MNKRRTFTYFFILVLTMFIIISCSNQKDVANYSSDITNTEHDDKSVVSSNEDVQQKEDIQENTEKNTEENVDPKDLIDLSLKPNEAGEVMILMYHNIGEKESDWVRTPDNFRKDLQTLYDKGYRPISLKDFVNNNITIEAGYTPIVITFDDGNRNNFNIIEKDGEKIIDPNCAVGILKDFEKSHPDFKVTATFFINGTRPFRQDELIEYKLKYLVENGFDVGNHTIGHNDMSKINDPEEIQRAIAKEVEFIKKYLPNYDVNTYALCNGGRPKNKDLLPLLVEGEYDGIYYKNIAILNVGARPSLSPINKEFNPYSIPRVRASEMNVDNLGLYDWLNRFDKYPEKKFISDGNSDIVTVPKAYESNIDMEKVKDKVLYLY